MRAGAAVAVLLGLLAGGAPEPAAGQPGPDRYIVVYEGQVRDPASATARRERAQGFRAEHRFSRALKGFAAPLARGQVRELERDPAVAAVVPDRRVRAARLVAVAAGEEVPTGVRRIGAATTAAVRQGSGARVAVLDSGIDLDHPDLNALDGVDCVNPGTSADDDDGHGTQVAGVIGARNNGSGGTGVAPGTPVVAVKVLDGNGNGYDSDLICGLDWVTATRTDRDPSNDIAVANLSLGGADDAFGSCPDPGDPLHRAICRASATGVTHVAAAGNESRALDEPGGPSTPAAYPQVLAVTAMADSDGAAGGGGPRACGRDDDDVAAGFSSFASTAAGAAHTLAAPGVCIASTARGGGLATVSGTSVAAPHVAGLAALCHAEGGVAGACAGRPGTENVRRLVGYGAARARQDPGFGFAGDPLRPSGGRIFGHLAWGDADMRPPAVTVSTPANGARGTDPTPALSGTAGTDAGDAAQVLVEIFAGRAATGQPARTVVVGASGGRWSAVPAALAPATYSLRASQVDAAGNTGRSAVHVFTVQAAAAPGPAGSAPPGSSPRSASVIAPAEGRVLHPAKLEVARSRVLRSNRAVDVLAPITRRASGEVEVDFHAAGRHTRFEARVDEENGRLRFRQDIPREQAAMGTGILTLTYPGNQRTRGQEVRLRAAHRRAELDLERPTLAAGRLRAQGTISRRARGVVRVQLSWSTGGDDRSVELHARIRDGHWKLDERLSDELWADISRRDGTVHSYTLFTGYLPARMRGEMEAYQVLEDLTR